MGRPRHIVVDVARHQRWIAAHTAGAPRGCRAQAHWVCSGLPPAARVPYHHRPHQSAAVLPAPQRTRPPTVCGPGVLPARANCHHCELWAQRHASRQPTGASQPNRWCDRPLTCAVCAGMACERGERALACGPTDASACAIVARQRCHRRGGQGATAPQSPGRGLPGLAGTAARGIRAPALSPPPLRPRPSAPHMCPPHHTRAAVCAHEEGTVARPSVAGVRMVWPCGSARQPSPPAAATMGPHCRPMPGELLDRRRPPLAG